MDSILKIWGNNIKMNLKGIGRENAKQMYLYQEGNLTVCCYQQDNGTWGFKKCCKFLEMQGMTFKYCLP